MKHTDGIKKLETRGRCESWRRPSGFPLCCSLLFGLTFALSKNRFGKFRKCTPGQVGLCQRLVFPADP